MTYLGYILGMMTKEEIKEVTKPVYWVIFIINVIFTVVSAWLYAGSVYMYAAILFFGFYVYSSFALKGNFIFLYYILVYGMFFYLTSGLGYLVLLPVIAMFFEKSIQKPDWVVELSLLAGMSGAGLIFGALHF